MVSLHVGCKVHWSSYSDKTTWVYFWYFWIGTQYYRFPLLELFKLKARFILRPGQHVNNMEENTNYWSLQCNSLCQILKNKGIPHSNKRKRRTSKPLWERWSLKFTTYWSKWFSRHLLEDGLSKAKRTRIQGTVPSWTGRKICDYAIYMYVSNWHLSFNLLRSRHCTLTKIIG